MEKAESVAGTDSAFFECRLIPNLEYAMEFVSIG
jgi:hypothetical protein